MFATMFAVLVFIAIIYVLVEVFSVTFIGVYGVFTIIKNCISYIINPKFRRACQLSDDPQFILKAHNADEF